MFFWPINTVIKMNITTLSTVTGKSLAHFFYNFLVAPLMKDEILDLVQSCQ